MAQCELRLKIVIMKSKGL